MRKYGLPYKGSKNQLAEWIVDLLPPADTLVDLFAGGCANTGLQKGIIKGETRSGLLYKDKKLLEKAVLEDNTPKYLIMENVKALADKKLISISAERISDEKSTISIMVIRCANCKYWDLQKTECSNPNSKRTYYYTPPEHEICELFEEEKGDFDVNEK